jgi:hypothetical protein
MQDIISTEKGKREWHTPRMVEVFYPLKISSTQDRHNWITAMMLDARLNDRDKVLLTRLALHLNLKTGRLDPTIDLLALETSLPGIEESARRMARRSLERAEKLGWIERTGRHAGSRINRSNFYRLTIPKDIRPDKSDRPSGQIEQVVRTPVSGRIGKENREGEHSLSSIEHRSLALAVLAVKGKEEGGSSRKESEASSSSHEEPWRGYTEEEVERVRDIILADGVDTIGGVVACARSFGGNYITGNVIGNMCRDGHFGREGDRIFLLDENAVEARTSE